MPTESRFLFTVCQCGAEKALKAEIGREWPGFRFSYSRPGFVTFRLPEDQPTTTEFDLRSTFARAWGFSLGRIVGQRTHTMASELWEMANEVRTDHLHVWQRDTRLPGDRGFEPGISLLSNEVGEIIAAERPVSGETCRPLLVNRRAAAGQTVLDCVLVEPGEWWCGFHKAASVPSKYPAGVCVSKVGTDVISRAYWKTLEALNWSQMPLERGDRCAEIGSAPGGSCQALLEKGLHVLGVDPAEMDESLLDHPNFIHFRMRASGIKRREFQGVRWLSVDTNVAPRHTLDTVESLVKHPAVHIRGLLLTLKFSDWQLADQVPKYLDRIQSWGYRHVRARQLAFNRQEICVAALRSRSMRRKRKAKGRRQKAEGQREEASDTRSSSKT